MANDRFDEVMRHIDRASDRLNGRISEVQNHLQRQVDRIETKIDKIDERFNRIEAKIDSAMAGNQIIAGQALAMEILLLFSIRTKPKDEIETIMENWKQVSFEDIDLPPTMKETFIRSHKEIENFLGKNLV